MAAPIFAASNFLFPNATFIAEIVAFLVVLGVLAKYVLPPVNKAINDRQAQIRSGLDAAEEGRRLLADAHAQHERLLEEGRREARSIVEQATKVAEQAKADILASARQEAQRLAERARADIAREAERAAEDLRRDLVNLVIETAERVIGAELDAERHRRLIEDAVAALESNAA